ncbi:hypothetical protein DES53_103194 [Roseimicrobium gellanilyticum]|uniref:Uncharacterized protein n=1 Tax=Roseimicrobium gellanilyticum TaxID=748857 RepID=A0A366HNW9_9BACT|nr:hypothetical protein DES53_103194 [Roseimicrobium gellanilyticum]
MNRPDVPALSHHIWAIGFGFPFVLLRCFVPWHLDENARFGHEYNFTVWLFVLATWNMNDSHIAFPVYQKVQALPQNFPIFINYLHDITAQDGVEFRKHLV